MLRLTAVLCAGLYLGLLLGGADRGQLREGLRNAPPPEPAVATVEVVEEVSVAAPAEPPPEPAREPEPQPALASAGLPDGVGQMPMVDPASFSSIDDGSAFSFASTEIGLIDLVPDEAAAAALSGGTGTEATETRVVSAASVNIRTAPTTEADVTGRLLRGEEVLVVGAAQDGWFRVRIEGDGGEGYVAERYLVPLITN